MWIRSLCFSIFTKLTFVHSYVSDIVEGMVNKGIFLNGDNGGTFLHFGNYQNSCISDPMLCGPEGESTASYANFQLWNRTIVILFLIALQVSPSPSFGKTLSQIHVLLWPLEGKSSPTVSQFSPTLWWDTWRFTPGETTADGRPRFQFQVLWMNFHF